MAKRTMGAGERRRRKRLVAEWRRSGESAAEFGGRRGISQWSLYSWVKQLGAGPNRRRQQRRPVRSSTTAAASGFIPVRLVGDGHADPPTRAEGAVEIQLRGGDVVRVVGEVSAERLRAVVTAVRQAC
jgi:transposase-like protein